MVDVILYRLSITFAITTTCIAGLLAVQSRDILHEFPSGSSLGLFALVMFLTTVYHVGLLVVGSETVLLQVLLGTGYVLLLFVLCRVLGGLRDDDWAHPGSGHRAVVLALVGGLVLYAIVGPFSEVYLPGVLHWVHGFAALATIPGLAIPVHDQLPRAPSNEVCVTDATTVGHPEWVRPIDDSILELLYVSGLVLTPAVIACNIDYSRDEINRRLGKLEEEGLVERVERGKYVLTETGQEHLDV